MKAIVTGGAGFIGRWVVKALLDKGIKVCVLDNLSNGSNDNLVEFKDKLVELIIGDVRDNKLLKELFKRKFDCCIHMAASINVQDSIDNPTEAFDVNVVATFNIMEEAKKNNTKVVFLSSALVYEKAEDKPIDENQPTKPSSPYAASKIAAENIVLSYFYTYSFPSIVVRPFSAYGPFQRPDTEGGVMSIFIKRKLRRKPLEVFGDGRQTRDFFYVEDCADFIVRCALVEDAKGEIFNAGSGKDISINSLAMMIAGDSKLIKHVRHHHPQSEVARLACNWNKAKVILGWSPKVSLADGIKKTEDWIKSL